MSRSAKRWKLKGLRRVKAKLKHLSRREREGPSKAGRVRGYAGAE